MTKSQQILEDLKRDYKATGTIANGTHYIAMKEDVLLEVLDNLINKEV